MNQSFNPRATLENQVTLARQIQGVSGVAQPNTITIRPVTLIQILRHDPSLVEWVKGRDALYAPTYCDRAGQRWHVDISDALIPRVQEKFVGPINRGLMPSTREASRG